MAVESNVTEPEVLAKAEPPDRQWASELRRYYHREFGHPISARLWRLRLLLALLKQTARNAPALRRQAGLSPWALLKDGWETCNRDECWPASYYRFRLFRSDLRSSAGDFIHEQVGLRIMRHLNNHEEVAILDDKRKFATACAQLGLPHVQTVAYFENGEVLEREPGLATGLPSQDLFAKSTNLMCGRGAEKWSYDPRSETYERHGLRLNAAALLERYRRMSVQGVSVPFWKRVRSHIPQLGSADEREDWRARPYILQRGLKNHSLIERFTNGALCSVRVVTARARGGDPQLILAALRMPTGDSSVDNFAAGGLASPIDLTSGRLGRAVYKDPRKPDAVVHPDSAARIEGETVPMWTEILDLCLVAHRSFPKVATVGWDVAITTDGLKLVEANPGWCVELAQITHGIPLGQTIWPELMLSHAA